MGATSFQDFYFEMKAKMSGERIDYSQLSSFCGYTGEPLPWETETEYRIRSARNMAGALAAMIVIGITVMTLFLGSIWMIFYVSGGFDE